MVNAGKREEVAAAADCDLARSRDKTLTKMTHLFSNRRPEFYRGVLSRWRARA